MSVTLPLLTVTNLSYEYAGRCLVANLNFSLNAGQVLHIYGANGSGKTSLLRLLCGLTMASEGDIAWRGRSIASAPQLFWQELIYIGHELGINVGLSAIENLKLSALLGKRLNEVTEYEALLAVGLQAVRDTIAEHLSAGQQRRIALARLFLLDARVWILDEPFITLDQQTIMLIEQAIIRHVNAGGIVIITTHQALSLANVKVQQLYLSG